MFVALLELQTSCGTSCLMFPPILIIKALKFMLTLVTSVSQRTVSYVSSSLSSTNVEKVVSVLIVFLSPPQRT